MDSRSHSARKRSRTAETTLAPSAPRSESTATATAIINTGTFTATKVLKTSHSRTSSTSASAGGSMSTSMSMSNPGNHHLLNEIDKLKTEITNVNSQRKIDKIQLTNKAKRLQRHILALEQDVQDSNELTQELEAIRDQKDLELERVTRMRDGLQQAYWDLKDGNGNDNGIEGDVVGLRNDLLLEQKKNEFMNEKVNALLVEIEMLKDLNGNQENVNVNVDPSSAVPTTPGKELTPADAAASSPSFTSLVSPAPPAVLSELNRTRVQLAEAERITRQQKRTMANLQSQADQMIQYRQAANNQKETVTKLESELKSVRRERDGLRVVEGRWVEMRKELLRYNLGSDILTVDSNIDTSGSVNDNTGVGVGTSKIDSENIPPEIATVMRKFQTLHQQVHKLQTETTSLRTKHDHAQNRIQELNEGHTKLQTDHQRSHDKQVECKSQLAKALMELRTIQKKEKVWKREAEGMRSLLDTYEQMEDNMAKQGKTKTEQQKFESVSASASSIGTSSVSVKYESKANTNATIQGLQLSLSTSQDEIKILKEQLETSNSEKDVLQTKLASLQSEHEAVRSKFIKLRSALMEAREKVSKAEDRAAKAETLAGKGSFSNSTTRVLHLPDNPLSKAIRTKYESEIEGLKAELLDMANLVNVGRSSTSADATVTAAAAANSNTSMLSSSDPALDAEKFSKRLKDQFREQISLFREGVHIITGYKIDMNLTDPDAPRFAVRSMFAERESDQLNLLWRKDKYGKLKSSMDILDSELAQLLFKEPSFEYMRKFSSLPAFTASVCLSLFEKQTLMI